jgi:Asp-tRNA(Asn)/Glu-tRNA(Gln) amidotransferase B subunit
MNEQRRQILEMLSEGKITADEAERLIAALEQEQPEPASAPAGEQRPKNRPKYLRVVVSMTDNFGKDGPGKVNIRVPVQLLRAGVRLTSLIPPHAVNRVNEELRKSGVPIDLNQLKPQHIEDLIEQLDDIHIDVDQPEAKVQVFCE